MSYWTGCLKQQQPPQYWDRLLLRAEIFNTHPHFWKRDSERERVEDLNSFLSPTSSPPALQHTLALKHTHASLLLSNCKIKRSALKSGREREGERDREERTRVHKYRNPLLFVWLCTWSQHSSRCTICGSARTCDFWFSIGRPIGAGRGGGPSGSLGYLCDWRSASCSGARGTVSLMLLLPPRRLWRNLGERRDGEKTQERGGMLII